MSCSEERKIMKEEEGRRESMRKRKINNGCVKGKEALNGSENVLIMKRKEEMNDSE